ncbi:putative ABC transporter (periplasmic binding protein) [Bradyrhizobium sp. ORS 375]|uniref:substrate-binding periplasmic protein n=1 Tax=Bradyrhizobium sp. (strain ORS 375) TaxID=566679 RepID=UPI0002408B96|nr:transporter substrate-binding domain-containing protein [Bradyrhizobium sp. ORS 375]CCD96164.1 putative ABC transporter (periplasmic binding protein) [Bradyrhizobium sp. ORS 375]
MRRLACWAVALLMATASSAAQAADEVLRICLDENLPPLSVHHRGKPGSGFDVLLGQAIADRLGKKLEIQWFESKLDEDSSPALEANALLSDGRCSLVASYAFTQDGLVAPGVKTAKLPDFDGATRDDRRRRIPLGALTPSKPYMFSTLTVVLGPDAKQRQIRDIGDLAGLRLAIESGTLADAILMTFDKGRLIDDITHLIPARDDLLGALEQGKFDATLLDSRRFDAYRAAHPDSKLAPSGYSYPIGVNRGYVGLSSSADLLASVDRVLADLHASGTLTDLARSAGLTYLPPREPVILGDAFQKIIRSGAR